MPTANNREERQLEMGVLVRKPATGKLVGHIAEAQLEKYGWGTDPLAAVEAIRKVMCKENGDPWGDDVEVQVHTDEESGYPVKSFHLVADFSYTTTRPEKALRVIGQYLIDMANRNETSTDAPIFTGQGIQLLDEGEVS